MSRAIYKLTARQVETISKPGRHSDGGNLYLAVSPSGSRRWISLYRYNGRQREMGLGSASQAGVTLARARELAAQARMLLQNGIDPIDDKRKKDQKNRSIPSFGEWADLYVETHRKAWRNEKHAAQWSMTLTIYCAPIRSFPVNEVDTEGVLKVLQSIWTQKPETAQRLRGRIENVLDAARARGLRDGENPARWKGHLQNLLSKPKKLTRGHFAALAYDQVPAFLQELAASEAVAARALEFTILTACRTGEVVNAVWEEIDTDTAIWIIPATKTKSGKEHRVPLSPRALDILDGLPHSQSNRCLFAGLKPRKPLSSMAMAMQLRRMNRHDITVHGFRSSFREWASETTSFPHEVCESALAHAIANKTEAAYQRGDLLEKRRGLMDAWSDYCYPGTLDSLVVLHA